MKSLNNKGLSLIELMVAIAIISIAGTMLFYGFVASGSINLNTTELQMAEDVAQHVSEEFKTHSVEWLLNQYASLSPTDDTVDIQRTVKFSNIPYTYEVKAGLGSASFLADVTLTSKITKPGEVARDTTYKQNGDSSTFYAVEDTVGTNTFIVPEITNIYDGKNVVASAEFNEYDSSVVSNLYNALMNQIVQKNNEILAANPIAPTISLEVFDMEFSAMFIPLSNVYNYDNDIIEKKTEIEIVEKATPDKAEYFYIVNTEYNFDFDIQLLYTNGTTVSYGSMKDIMPTNLDTSAEGAVSTYTVSRTGTKYTVKYEEELDSSVTGSPGETGTFAGKITLVDPDTGVEETYVPGGTDTKVPNVYFLYSPFDIYTDNGGTDGNYVSTDSVEFKYSGSGANIARVFLVVQDAKHAVDTEAEVGMKNCDVKSGDFLTELRVYTNSTEIIDDSSNNIDGLNYLTNSYGKSHYNLYDMNIVLKDATGKVVAELNTVKED